MYNGEFESEKSFLLAKAEYIMIELEAIEKRLEEIAEKESE